MSKTPGSHSGLCVPGWSRKRRAGKLQASGRQAQVGTDRAVGRVLLLDDFAHHPKEIAAVMDTVKAILPDSRVVALFQPHRYSRTKLLHAQFGTAFSKADAVVVTGIYGGPGEKQDPEADPGMISKAIEQAGHPCVSLVHDMEEAAALAAGLCGGEAVLITLGAGDIWKAHDILKEALAT